MKSYLLYTCLPLLALFLIACEHPGELKVRNSIHGAAIKEVRWGDVFMSQELLPGETSATAFIYDEENSSLGVNLPASYPIKFYMDVDGDLIYLQTRATYSLDEEQKVEVVLNDTTKVFNPALED